MKRQTATPSNPFAIPRQTRSVTVTFRMTPGEHQAVKEIADRERVEIVQLIREGLALVIDRRLGRKEPR